MDEQALTAEQVSAWLPLAAVMQLLPGQIDSRLQRRVGHPLVTLHVLGHLQRAADRSAGLSELAACTSSALPRMSRIVARMEADGLVERTACTTDGRAVTVRLTEPGERLLAEAMPHHDSIVRELVIDGLSTTQLDQLREIGRTLAARLHPDVASPVDRQRRAVPA